MGSDPKTLRVATYNVQNLFAEPDIGATKPRVAVRAVAHAMDVMAADIVALQEVGSLSALERLNGLMRKPYSHLYWLPGNSQRGIHLAFMSQLPLACTSQRALPLFDEDGSVLQDHARPPAIAASAPKPMQLQRDLLTAQLIGESSFSGLTLCNVHLKSKTNQAWRLNTSETIRAAEARAIAAEMATRERQSPHLPRVLLGDFNDLMSSDALKSLRQLGWTDVVAADHHKLGRPGRLPGTYWPRRSMRIDHILLNPSLAGKLVMGSARTHVSSPAKRGSDHYPVSVDLNMTPTNLSDA